jgi:hypothetical protein
MTDAEREHTGEQAEGSEHPGQDPPDGRTPRAEEPAEGKDLPEPGADSPGTA